MRLGLGELHKPDDEAYAARFARWHFFRTIYRQRADVLPDLRDTVYVHYQSLDESLNYTTLEEVKDEAALLDALRAWSKRHALDTLGDWALELALCIMKEWQLAQVFHDPSIDLLSFVSPRLYLAQSSIEERPKPPSLIFATAPSFDEDLAVIYKYVENPRDLTAGDVAELLELGQRLSDFVNDYDPTGETRATAKRRILKAFEKRLTQYLDEVEDYYKATGHIKVPTKRTTRHPPKVHFDWLYQRVFESLTCEEIAYRYSADLSEHRDLSGAAVSEATRDLAELIGMTLFAS